VDLVAGTAASEQSRPIGLPLVVYEAHKFVFMDPAMYVFHASWFRVPCLCWFPEKEYW